MFIWQIFNVIRKIIHNLVTKKYNTYKQLTITKSENLGKYVE